MCIINYRKVLERERAKKSPLVLWKVIRRNNMIGVWCSTYAEHKKAYRGKTQEFYVGVNVAKPFHGRYFNDSTGEFCCFTTRKSARLYRKYTVTHLCNPKIIKVYADRADIVHAGKDGMKRAISVSKFTIKSLNHRR